MHFNLKYQKETESAASCSAEHSVWIPKSYLKVTTTLNHSLSHCLTENLEHGLLLTVQFDKYVLNRDFLKVSIIEIITHKVFYRHVYKSFIRSTSHIFLDKLYVL